MVTHFVDIFIFLTSHKLIKIFNLYHNTCNQAILKIEMLNSITLTVKKNILSTVLFVQTFHFNTDSFNNHIFIFVSTTESFLKSIRQGIIHEGP